MHGMCGSSLVGCGVNPALEQHHQSSRKNNGRSNDGIHHGVCHVEKTQAGIEVHRLDLEHRIVAFAGIEEGGEHVEHRLALQSEQIPGVAHLREHHLAPVGEEWEEFLRGKLRRG